MNHKCIHGLLPGTCSFCTGLVTRKNQKRHWYGTKPGKRMVSYLADIDRDNQQKLEHYLAIGTGNAEYLSGHPIDA